MAERIARLYGPAVATSTASPTTLFTVPTGELYIIRAVSATTSPLTGGAVPTQTVVGGLTNLSVGNRIFGVPATIDAGVVSTAVLNISMPVTEGEIVVAGSEIATTAAARQDWEAANDAVWGVLNTANATTYDSTTDTPQSAVGNNAYVFLLALNSKATTPDAISAWTNTYAPSPSTATSIVSTATAGIRASIWGSYHTTRPTASGKWTAAFGGATQTGFANKQVSVTGMPFTQANPTTSTVIHQAVSATGTTELTPGVTMTPTAAAEGKSWQLLLVGVNGVATTIAGPTGSTEIADGTYATPNVTGGIYFIYPAQTNPAATIGLAGTDWAAVCIEGKSGTFLDLTVSGVIID